MMTAADEIWGILRELSQSQQETGRRFQETERLLREASQETDRKFQETDRQLKETDRMLKAVSKNLVIIVYVDITEQRRIEAARAAAKEDLRAERQRLQNVIDGTRAGTWEWQVQTGAVVVNAHWAAMLGYRLAELGPLSIQTWLDLAHPDDLQESERRLAAHFAGQSPAYDCEVRLRHKDGHWVWVADRGAPTARHPRRHPG